VRDHAAGIRSWENRIQRAEALAGEGGPSAPLLEFYARLLREQKTIYEGFSVRPPARVLETDAAAIAAAGTSLLHAVAGHGPDLLVAQARGLLDSSRCGWEELLLTYWRTRSSRSFFAKALLQPYARWLIDSGVVHIAGAASVGETRCPHCDGVAQLSILEAAGATTGDGSTRRLQCATCLTAWPVRRVLCPSCGEEDERKLGYYHSPLWDHIRVDACETCRQYLKTIDLGRLGLAVPLVDEVAGAALDLWAQERGYAKIELNLVGL
jgi:formate dehydrogenase maturation protein FdhE